MKRDEALKIVNDWTSNKNLVKHMLAVEAEMRAIAKHFGEDPDLWGMAGLLHDADYDKYPDQHPRVILEDLEKRGENKELIDTIKRHAWNYNGMDEEPVTRMDWALYTCDELSGLIIACALVRPEKKLSAVTLEAVQKKWKEKSFAKGVIRENIALCEEKLGITLPDYIEMCIKALQGISAELGL